MIIIPFHAIATVFDAVNFGVLITILWRLKLTADRFLNNVNGHVTETVNQAKDAVIDKTDTVETELETFVAQQVEHSKQAVTSHLTEHAAELTKSVNAVEAHSKAVVEARSQQLGSASIQRAVCPSCQRVCYKFTRRADGTVFACDNCVARNQ